MVDDASDDGTAEVACELHRSAVSLASTERPPGRSGGPKRRDPELGREFVAFLDDDDEWLPEKLELQVALFRRGGPEVGVVYSSYIVVDRETGRVVGR